MRLSGIVQALEHSAILKTALFAPGNMTAGLRCADPIEQASDAGHPALIHLWKR